MNRKEFLKITGIGAGAFILASCLGGCKKEEDDSPSGPDVDFTLDLTQPSNSALNTAGGFIYMNGVIVAKTNSGSYLAVASACTHEGTAVQYELSPNRFHCPNHGSNFTSSGQVINGPASQSLRSYQTTLTGNMLRVFS